MTLQIFQETLIDLCHSEIAELSEQLSSPLGKCRCIVTKRKSHRLKERNTSHLCYNTLWKDNLKLHKILKELDTEVQEVLVH